MPRDVTSDDYARGRRDGLRLALAVLAAEEAKWTALLGDSPSWRTNTTREVRHMTLHVAQTRIRTALSRLTPRGDDGIDAELAAAIEAAGLLLPTARLESLAPRFGAIIVLPGVRKALGLARPIPRHSAAFQRSTKPDAY